jgi:C-terminal processing protease CtpA/Prc
MLTPRAPASASELVANALRPYMPVVLIGDRTYGKPVGQYGFEFCTKVLALVSFSLKNADGQGDYFDGLAPTCQAADDVTHEIGDVEEESLREALQFIDSDRCSGARAAEPGAAPLAVPRSRAPVPTNGWQQLIGAN